MHGSTRSKHAPQGAEARIRIGQVVQDAGADDLVELLRKLLSLFDGQPLEIEIVKSVPLPQEPRLLKARFADIDPDDPRARPSARMSCRLNGAASCNQD